MRVERCHGRKAVGLHGSVPPAYTAPIVTGLRQTLPGHLFSRHTHDDPLVSKQPTSQPVFKGARLLLFKCREEHMPRNDCNLRCLTPFLFEVEVSGPSCRAFRDALSNSSTNRFARRNVYKSKLFVWLFAQVPS